MVEGERRFVALDPLQPVPALEQRHQLAVAALQEAGTIPVDPLGVPRMAMLGVFPTVQTIAAQLLVLGLIVAGYVMNTRARRPAVA